MSKPDGGSAFPASVAEIQGRATHSGEFGLPGLSVRDYFAAHAPSMDSEWLKGLPAKAGEDFEAWMARRLALWALTYADAMIAEREK